MLKSTFVVLFMAAVVPLAAQNWATTPIGQLPTLARESSGLTFFNGKLITHNDSGNPPLLFELDTLTGAITRSVTLPSNVDWEDVTNDGQYLYIGDFGNNLGNRTNLVVYRVSTAAFNDPSNVVAPPEVGAIHFAYPEQSSFPGAPFQTAFDAEALFSYGQNLYIITKNWTASQSFLYQLPKTPGQFSAVLIDTLPTQGLVTAAEADSANDVLYITLNTPSTARLLLVTNLQQWLGGQAPATDQYNLQTTGSIQVEAVAVRNGQTYFSAETGNFGQGYLFKSSSGLTLHAHQLSAVAPFPNPSFDGQFSLQMPTNATWQFIDATGREIPIVCNWVHDQAVFKFIAPAGIYFLMVTTPYGHQTIKIIKK